MNLEMDILNYQLAHTKRHKRPGYLKDLQELKKSCQSYLSCQKIGNVGG